MAVDGAGSMSISTDGCMYIYIYIIYVFIYVYIYTFFSSWLVDAYGHHHGALYHSWYCHWCHE